MIKYLLAFAGIAFLLWTCDSDQFKPDYHQKIDAQVKAMRDAETRLQILDLEASLRR